MDKEEIYIWSSKYALSKLLLHQEKEEEKANRQREWIFHIISENCNNNKIFTIFEILSELGEDIRKDSVILFVSLNKDFSIFKKLSLESNHWGGLGSMIPYMQQRVEYYNSLLPYFTGMELLKHKKLIKENINVWKRRIEQEQIDEIFEELYK
jgi:deoxyhypusine synthase